MRVLLNPDSVFPNGLVVDAYFVLSYQHDKLLVKLSDEQMAEYARRKIPTDRWLWRRPGTYKVLDIEDYEKRILPLGKLLIAEGVLHDKFNGKSTNNTSKSISK